MRSDETGQSKIGPSANMVEAPSNVLRSPGVHKRAFEPLGPEPFINEFVPVRYFPVRVYN